jgi:hypothetical protein
MKESVEYLKSLGARRVFVPGGFGFEVGPGLGGKRALVASITRVFGDSALRIIRPAVYVGSDGMHVWSGLERLNRLLAGDRDDPMSVSESLALFPIWEQFKPRNLEIQINEVDVLPRSLPKEYIPQVAQRFNLVIEWTSKSHPLRVLGLPTVLDIAEAAGLDYTQVSVYRAFRELRSLLKNGLPLLEPDPDKPYGDILRDVVVGVAPMKGERTDLVYATPTGAEKLRFVRRFDGEDIRMKLFMRDAVRYEEYEDKTQASREAAIVQRRVRGELVFSPQTMVKLVTIEGVKGMCVTLNDDVEVNGEKVDLLVDVRSVISKGAQLKLEGEGPWILRTKVGATDHGSPMHREQSVSVRPEAALFGGLIDTVDPLEHLEPGLLEELDEVWRMARELYA